MFEKRKDKRPCCERSKKLEEFVVKSSDSFMTQRMINTVGHEKILLHLQIVYDTISGMVYIINII